uniref:Ubiquitin conjugation factor E4 A n=1 Tax=Dermatophagoides pteronyssinus TaxID=6956 RepID=A0A6P6YDN5_DERPT|nr:ubiquitin conjugation factor E4 A-like [Dermatophagoides pteronyssinus]
MSDLEINILENKTLYNHQYLTAIFQIYPQQQNNGINLNDGERQKSDNENDVPIICSVFHDASDDYLSFENYSLYVFESLIEKNFNENKYYIDKRFFSDQRSSLFRSNRFAFRIFDDYTNSMAYLFDCYCRYEIVKDFANLIPLSEQKTLKRYIIDQAALLLVMPDLNKVASTNGSNDDQTMKPFNDLLEITQLTTPWLSDHMNYFKKFFVDITDTIHAAKMGIQNSEYNSSLSDLSPGELNLNLIIKPLYERFCENFKKSHLLTPIFIDDITSLNILVASPTLAEIFIDLNSPSSLLESGVTSSSNASSSQNNRGPSFNNNEDAFRNPMRDVFLNSIMNVQSNNSVDTSQEKIFQECLLGILLSNSPLPSLFSSKKNNTNLLNLILNNPDFEYQFFNSPTTHTPSEMERIELQIDDYLQKLRTKLTDLFYSLLRSPPQVRTKTLKWIECCLATFNTRSKLWMNELFTLVSGNTSQISDGFLLNFSAVLLNLCKPFCTWSENNCKLIEIYPAYSINEKMLKVDPLYIRYCRQEGTTTVTNRPNDYGPYLNILKQESSLISGDNFASRVARDNSNNRTTDQSSSTTNISQSNVDEKPNISGDDYQPNFISRLFFMTHKSLHIGFRVIHERFTAINQENGQLQRRLDQLGMGMGFNSMTRNNLNPQQQETLTKFDRNMTVTLSMKSALTETNYLNLLLEFYLATASWINNLAVCPLDKEGPDSFIRLDAQINGKNYFQSKPSPCLQWVPEFIIENIIDFMLFLRYFEIKPKVFSLKSGLEPFMVMSILFMGSPQRMRNPHLRAKMAEMLEALLPTVQANFAPFHLEQLFLKPYFIEELFPALLSGFVSIEISDEANNADVVAFEQKFNYRRPMYVVFKYLCTIEQHQMKLIDLAAFAEANVDCVQLPIFLRFINLLINDAIFLLDEGLSLMSKLREIQQERESDAWSRLPQVTRQHNEANFVHLGRLAKFHNFIGRDTIATLATITSHVKSFFSHRILVDRMAAMLNYFLHNLVGPNKRNFKVKQMNDYEFNPGELVKNISRIYVNLACNNPISIDMNNTIGGGIRSNQVNPRYEEFCLAIGRDDRSYSPDLLIQAEEILTNKLGQPMLGQDMLVVDKSVKELILRHRHSEIPMDDIPEEFLDPLMSTLMSDPVILPNSHKILDRATITRHLLSDHTDPYTRTPLTMDMLIPDVELKKRIETFIANKSKEMNKE